MPRCHTEHAPSCTVAARLPPRSLQSASQRRSWWHRTYSSRYDERRYFAFWEGNLNKTIAWNLKPGISYWRGLTDQFS